MEYRNIKRWILFNKAFRKWVKRYPSITPADITLLFVISSFKSCTRSQVEKRLLLINRSCGPSVLVSRLNTFATLGYVNKVKVKDRYIYSLSLSGVNLISSFEYVLRRERYDK